MLDASSKSLSKKEIKARLSERTASYKAAIARGESVDKIQFAGRKQLRMLLKVQRRNSLERLSSIDLTPPTHTHAHPTPRSGVSLRGRIWRVHHPVGPRVRSTRCWSRVLHRSVVGGCTACTDNARS